MSTKPDLDPELHEGDTVTSVWKRRMVLGLLILLVVAIAAPTFGGCSGSLSHRELLATYVVDGEEREVSSEDLYKFMHRYASAMGFLGIGGLPDGEEGEKEALRLLVLDDVAKASGIHVSDDEVAAMIHRHGRFQVGGKFDEGAYRAALEQAQRGLSHRIVSDMLRLELRVREYVSLGSATYDVVPGDEVYDSWKKRSAKLTVDYVASPLALQRAKVDALEPTDEDLAKIASLPAVKALLAVPPRKVVEVAYLKVADMTPAHAEAAAKFVEQAELLEEDRTLKDEAFMTFHADKNIVFTRERWAQLNDPGYPTKLADWEKAHQEWEAKPPEGRGAEPQRPKDPAEGYPTMAGQQFDVWRERVEKETLARLVTAHFGERAQREGKSFRDLLPDYERFGLRVVRNEEPLTDAEIVEKFPDPVARDSEFGQVVSANFRVPEADAVFKPQVHAKPVPTTQLAEKVADRGFMVLRLDACDPARQYQVTERREPVIEFWRRHLVSDNAKKLAEDVRAKAAAAGPDPAKAREALRAAAEEAGLKVETLRRFNRSTEAPKPPTAAPGEKLSPELEALAQKLTVRNRVQQDYPMLSSLEPGRTREPVLIDEKNEVVIAILVVEKHEPAPAEMRDDDLQQEKIGLAYQAMGKVSQVFSYDALAKRYQLARHDRRAKSEKPKDA